MTSADWLVVGAWVLVLAVAVAAHLFGRFAAPVPKDPDDLRSRRMARIGVAVSITGPLAVFVLGLGIAWLSGRWGAIGIATVVAVIAVAIVGFLLAPY